MKGDSLQLLALGRGALGRGIGAEKAAEKGRGGFLHWETEKGGERGSGKLDCLQNEKKGGRLLLGGEDLVVKKVVAAAWEKPLDVSRGREEHWKKVFMNLRPNQVYGVGSSFQSRRGTAAHHILKKRQSRREYGPWKGRSRQGTKKGPNTLLQERLHGID